MYTCAICKKEFSLPNNLSRHLNLHKKIDFTCLVCEKKFTRKDTLKKHIFIKHNKIHDQSRVDHIGENCGRSQRRNIHMDIEESYSSPGLHRDNRKEDTPDINNIVDELRILYDKKFTVDTSERIHYLVEQLREAGVIY